MRHNINKESENTDRWLVSYADFITLLFAFFVVMYSVSQVNEGKFKILSETLTDAFVQPERSLQPIQVGEVNKSDTTTSGDSSYPADYMGEPATPETDKAFEELRDNFSESLKELIDADLVKLRFNKDAFELDIRGGLLFPSGGDQLSSGALPLFKDIASKAKETPNAIKVSGYTDNIPIKTRRYSSNWALSSARAVAVVQLLQDNGVDPVRLSPVGYGEYQPIAPNDTPQGRAANRRVVISFSRFPPSKSELDRKAAEEAAASLLTSANAQATNNLQPLNTVVKAKPQVTLIRAPDGTLIIRGANSTQLDNTAQSTNAQPTNNQQ